MEIAGIANFQAPTVNNQLDFKSVEHAKVKTLIKPESSLVKPPPGTLKDYYRKITIEDIERVLRMTRKIAELAKEQDLVALEMPTILGPTGEPLPPVPPLYMNRSDAESAGLAIMSDVDIKI